MRPPWTSPIGYRAGVILLLAPVAFAAYVSRDERSEEHGRFRLGDIAAFESVLSAPAEDWPVAADASTSAPVTFRAESPPRPPSTVIYAAASRSASGTAIWRCKVGRRTLYTQEPCDDGRRVDVASPAAGFETRVRAGDTRIASLSPAPRSTSRADVRERHASLTPDCVAMAGQVADLDIEAQRSGSSRPLDALLQARSDLRARMSRERC